MQRLFYSVMLLISILILAACGGGPDPVSLTFQGEDTPFAFDPDSAAVPTGAEVTVTLNNVAVLEHSWVLISDTTDPTTATDEDAINGISSGIIPGGESGTFIFTAPSPGTYTIVCTIPGHAVGGMIGTLTVTEN